MLLSPQKKAVLSGSTKTRWGIGGLSYKQDYY